MNTSYSITSKFQVTIPKKLRDELRLTDKDRVSFERRGNELVVKKVASLEEVSNMLQADLKKRGWKKTVTDADMKRAKDIFNKKGGKW